MKHEEVFERIDPPPGGLAALRARMNARPSFARRAAPFALAAAIVALVFFVARRPRALDPVEAARQRADVGAVTLGLARMPAAAVAIDDSARATTALAEVKTSNPRVAFYWVSSTDWKE